MLNFVEIFEEEFEAVMEAVGAEGWWELFDSDDFDEVTERYFARCGEAEGFDEAWDAWTDEMAADL